MTKTENFRINVRSSYINSSMSVRNIGLILDNTREMEKQMNSICMSVIIKQIKHRIL